MSAVPVRPDESAASPTGLARAAAGDGVGAGDGRTARRRRNIEAVLDVVTDMFTEGELHPTVEQVAARSGVSARSIYRYFADPHELSDAAIRRHRERAEPLAHLTAIGKGPLSDRIESFVAMRLRLHAAIGPTFAASVHNARLHPRLDRLLQQGRADQRAQFERHFAPELAGRNDGDRNAVLDAGDLLTQLDSIELLRSHRGLTEAQTAAALRLGLRSLLEGAHPTDRETT